MFPFVSAVLVFAAGKAMEAPRQGADPVIMTASGEVGKATANTLVLHPRDPQGRYAASLTCKRTGTTVVSALSIEVRQSRPIAVQRPMNLGDLRPRQPIAVIYLALPEETILLAAVATRAP